MSVLSVLIGKRGIEKVRAEVKTIAEGNEAAQLFQSIGLSLRLLNDSVRESQATPLAPVPQGKTDLFLCVCGDRFESAETAITHVEQDHASPRIREDIDKLEDFIEGVITPSPLGQVSEEVFPIRSWRTELTNEIARILAKGEPKQDHFDRAQRLMSATEWGDLQDWNLMDIKRQIVNYGDDAPKIRKPLHEDFLKVVGTFALQVRRADQ
jgi:hypothetical protein